MAQENLIKRLRREVLPLEDIARLLHTDVAGARKTLSELKKTFALKEQNGGYFIRIADDSESRYIISPPSKRAQKIKFIYFSDTHFGCRQADKDGLSSVLEKAVRQGYEHAIMTGDICDGVNVYRGQMNNLTSWRIEDQVDEAKDVLDKFDLHYRTIGGNHDLAWEEQGSINPVKLLSESMKKRLEFMGTIRSDLLIGGVAIRLVHGAGGNSYSLSYPSQVYLRNVLGQGGLGVEFGENIYNLGILLMGHYHTKVHITEYGVEILQPGSFQKPNDFTERRGLRGPRGAWFVDFEARAGRLLDFNARYVYADGWKP